MTARKPRPAAKHRHEWTPKYRRGSTLPWAFVCTCTTRVDVRPAVVVPPEGTAKKGDPFP